MYQFSITNLDILSLHVIIVVEMGTARITIKEADMATFFEKNMTTVAAKTSLFDAAQTWEFSHFGDWSEFGRCQFCHQRIKRWSAIVNKNTGIELKIGLQCHDKLACLKKTGSMAKGDLKKHKVYVSAGKRWRRENLTDAVFAWLKANVPDTMKDAVKFIDKHGYPRSIEEAKLLLAFYNHDIVSIYLRNADKFFCGAARVVYRTSRARGEP